MNYKKEIESFETINNQESNDKRIMLELINKFSENVLLRDNEVAHITSSGFIMNRNLDKVLLIHHNIRNTWAWTGGHADGNANLLQVSINEACEETGVKDIQPLTNSIASLDILPALGHVKNGKYVSAHLHLSIAYILVCDETEHLKAKLDENSDVNWFNTSFFTTENFESPDVYLYNKLIARANAHNYLMYIK